MFLFGGTAANDILVYDPAVDIWSSLDMKLPDSRCKWDYVFLILLFNVCSWKPIKAAVYKSWIYLFGEEEGEDDNTNEVNIKSKPKASRAMVKFDVNSMTIE